MASWNLTPNGGDQPQILAVDWIGAPRCAKEREAAKTPAPRHVAWAPLPRTLDHDVLDIDAMAVDAMGVHGADDAMLEPLAYPMLYRDKIIFAVILPREFAGGA